LLISIYFTTPVRKNQVLARTNVLDGHVPQIVTAMTAEQAEDIPDAFLPTRPISPNDPVWL
jgi:hypothetical protein